MTSSLRRFKRLAFFRAVVGVVYQRARTKAADKDQVSSPSFLPEGNAEDIKGQQTHEIELQAKPTHRRERPLWITTLLDSAVHVVPTGAK